MGKQRTSGKSREASFEPVRRILFLYHLLRKATSGRKLTAQRAFENMNASGFDVSLRTVQRYLEQCENFFTGVRRDEGKPAGWWWEESALDDELHLSKEAAMALCLAEANLRHLIPSAELKHLSSLFQHARKVIEHGDGKSKYKKMLDRIWIFPRGLQLIAPKIDSRIFDRVMECVLESREITVKYRKPSEHEARTRKLRPLGIVERSGVYHLVASEQFSDVPKNWVLHRLESLEAGSYFSFPKGFKISEYAESGSLNKCFEPRKIDVHLQFSASAGAHLLESRLSANQVAQKNTDGTIDVKASVENSIELRWWIMSMANECVVLAPKSLKDEIHSKLNDAIALYAGRVGRRAG